MARGGWVLVLEQTNYPSWLPFTIQNFDATFAFPNTNHPAMLGLTSDDLRWWAGDHRVAANALAAPAQGNFCILASIGSESGLEYAAALEAPFGKGGLLCSQFLLGQKFDSEPVAGALLQRFSITAPPAPAIPPSTPPRWSLKPIRWPPPRWPRLAFNARTSPAALPLATQCCIRSSFWPAATQFGRRRRCACRTLRPTSREAATCCCTGPPSTFLAAAQPVLFPGLNPTDIALGKVLRRDSTNAVVHLFNHDLYWIAQPGNWNQTELLSTNIASRCYHTVFNLPASYNLIEVANMPIHSTGSASSGGWWLYQNGYVAQNIVATEPGTYLFNISASGTPAFGGWPQMLPRN